MKQTNKKGFAPILIVVIVLAIGLVAALGYIFYQNATKKDDTNATLTTTTSTNGSTNTNSNYTGYLLLGDWGVKFKIPDTLKSTTIKTSGSGDQYTLRTSTVDDTPGTLGCSVESNAVTISRNSSNVVPSADKWSSITSLGKFGDYNYYALTLGQDLCGDLSSSDYKTVGDQVAGLSELAKAISVK
jgi:hypothetical protein